MNFAEALEHFKRLKAENPLLEKAKLIDVSTPALLARHKVKGPVAMLGSKAVRMTETEIAQLRRFYQRLEDFDFVGIEAGMNVDVVADLCDPDFQRKHPALVARFGWMICGALLEHVKDPVLAARNVYALVKPGGRLYYLGPWVWGYHAYPDDLWRFSISGVKELFPGIAWKEWFYASTTKGVGVQLPKLETERAFLQIVKPPAPPQSLADLLTDRFMPYLNIGAVGRRAAP